jgi:DedD protein
MQKDQSDLGLIFKKRARRRLVGAIALVLLMFILLPIVLEDRTQTDMQQNIAIVMPDESTGGEVVVSEEVITIEDLKAETAVNTKKLALPKVTPVKPKENPKAVVEAKAEIKTTVEKKEVVAKETVKKTEAASKANPFYVQIGVFSDIANVKKLQVKLDGIGYKSVTEKMQTATGEKTRLRTSTFEGRNEAAIALENIKDAGLTGMVVSQK